MPWGPDPHWRTIQRLAYFVVEMNGLKTNEVTETKVFVHSFVKAELLLSAQ